MDHFWRNSRKRKTACNVLRTFVDVLQSLVPRLLHRLEPLLLRLVILGVQNLGNRSVNVDIVVERELLLVENQLFVLRENALTRNFQVPRHFKHASLDRERPHSRVAVAFWIDKNTVVGAKIARKLQSYRNSQHSRKNPVNHCRLIFLLLLNNQI